MSQPKQPMLRHPVVGMDGNILKEVPLCRECYGEVSKGFCTLHELHNRHADDRRRKVESKFKGFWGTFAGVPLMAPARTRNRPLNKDRYDSTKTRLVNAQWQHDLKEEDPTDHDDLEPIDFTDATPSPERIEW